MNKSVKEIAADVNTPVWVKQSLARLQKQQPGYAAFLEALHDIRVGLTTSE